MLLGSSNVAVCSLKMEDRNVLEKPYQKIYELVLLTKYFREGGTPLRQVFQVNTMKIVKQFAFLR